MIICKESRYWGAKEGKDVMDVWLIANATPSQMPANSDSVENMDNGKLFAPGSVLQVVGGSTGNGDVYFYNDGWYKWN